MTSTMTFSPWDCSYTWIGSRYATLWEKVDRQRLTSLQDTAYITSRAAPETAIFSLVTARTGIFIRNADCAPFAQNAARNFSLGSFSIVLATTPPVR